MHLAALAIDVCGITPTILNRTYMSCGASNNDYSCEIRFAAGH